MDPAYGVRELRTFCAAWGLGAQKVRATSYTLGSAGFPMLSSRKGWNLIGYVQT